MLFHSKFGYALACSLYTSSRCGDTRERRLHRIDFRVGIERGLNYQAGCESRNSSAASASHVSK